MVGSGLKNPTKEEVLNAFGELLPKKGPIIDCFAIEHTYAD